MTEAAWLAAAAIDRTVREFALKHLSDRKRRLFACACCRRVWDVLGHDDLRRGVEAAELHADGLLNKRALAAAREAVDRHTGAQDARDFHALAVKWALERHRQFPLCSSQYASEALAASGRRKFWSAAYQRAVAAEQAEQVVLLRDVVGNPFRPVAFAAEWRTSTAVALAQEMYESRDFGAMPILADALQDAGCDSGDVLDHCRAAAPHVRGCWVVDLVLGKE
ncbi:Uncharacterized protein OS=Sorangium cellulosum (strain So ce56) GN=sce5710 PE=4 SV=1 [Gemmataceae bacterium]|nr:Uncharacterized protein OS=Sorangium cellulosum (strain So ce56) GN=sce5710 PE=4 SV=1 [Gemmataceae bacterium]VTU01900.1 Uncharacterized protein OS=Sorangium cellulosum (strain So ce56) GN=sce5710 PE=4 SV=1 [Gemmataceae bacterium]